MKNDLNQKAIKAGIWYTVGNILLKGCSFLTLPIFAKIMRANDFGIYNTYSSYEGILTAIIGLGLYGTIKNAKIDFKEKFDEYLSSILSMSLIFLIIVLCIVNIFYEKFAIFLGFSRFVTNILVLQSYGSFLIYFYGSKLNIEFKYKSYLLLSFCNIIINIIISILLIIFVFPNEKYIGRILGTALPLIFISIILIIIIFKKSKKIFDKKYWKYALIIGLPLIPHVVSQSLLTNFDRIMITNIFSAFESGIYSYIYTLCIITTVIYISLDNAWSPWVFIKINSNSKQEIKEKSKYYIMIFSLITIGFICVMPDITILISDKEYIEGISLIAPLALSNYFVFLYSLPVNIEFYNKKTSFISLGTILSALLNFILNLLFLKRCGYKIAAYTTLISYAALFVFHWIIASKFGINDIYDKKYILKNTILLVIITFLINISIMKFKLASFFIRYFITIIILIIVFKNKNLIIKAIKGK